MSTDAESVGHVPMTDEGFGTASTGKIAMWIFLLMDAMSFSGFLLAYGILRAGSGPGVWPNPTDILGINFTAGMTFLLICSSVTMVMAVAAAQADDQKKLKLYLALTILGGLLFLYGQKIEYAHLFEQGINLWACAPANCPSQFASTFFSITGFHGLHVTSGVIYLIFVFVFAVQGRYEGGKYNEVEIVGLFWHFVDLVWILVFTFVYLL